MRVPSPDDVGAQAEAGAQHADKVVRLPLSGRQPRGADGELPNEGRPWNVEDGSFLISKLGAVGVIDQDMTAVLIDLRRRLLYDYGDGAAARMLIDQVIAAYQDFIRLTGWAANLSIAVEHELLDIEASSTRLHDPAGPDEGWIRGVPAAQQLARLRENLNPLIERCGCAMRETLETLERFRRAPR